MLVNVATAALLTLVAQVAVESRTGLPPHTNQEIVVRVTDARTKLPVEGVSLEWIDVTTGIRTPLRVTTDSRGEAIVGIPGGRYMLGARHPDGRQARPESVPSHKIEIELLAPLRQPVASAQQEDAAYGEGDCVNRNIQQPCGVCASDVAQVDGFVPASCSTCGIAGCQSCCEMLCQYSYFPCVEACNQWCTSDANAVWQSSAQLMLTVPKQAVVFINGRKTTSTGSNRVYSSEGLKEGARYHYVVRVSVEKDGQNIESTRDVILQRGVKKKVVFAFPTAERDSLASSESAF